MRRFIAVAGVSVAALALSGCMLEIASTPPRIPSGNPMIVSGQVTGFPITGTYRAEITTNVSAPPACGSFSSSVTLTDDAGNTVTKQEEGFGCWSTPATPTTLPTITFFGSYNVTGGTGIYAGATGSGTSIVTATPVLSLGVAWSSLEFGSFQVPGTASAASTRKRTFKMHGTVSAIELCKNAGKQDPITKQGCVKLTGETLNRVAP